MSTNSEKLRELPIVPLSHQQRVQELKNELVDKEDQIMGLIIWLVIAISGNVLFLFLWLTKK